jgi:hypothetical protein
LSRRDLPDLVPEGLTDRSQAIYCLEQVQSRIRPVGDGMILTHGRLVVLIVARLSDPIIPCPTGRFPFSHGYQAINCLATITSPSGTKTLKSLRDKDSQVPSGQQAFNTCPHFRPRIGPFSRTRTAARLSSPKSCPTKLPVCRLKTSVASEVGTTRTRTMKRGAALSWASVSFIASFEDGIWDERSDKQTQLRRTAEAKIQEGLASSSWAWCSTEELQASRQRIGR